MLWLPFKTSRVIWAHFLPLLLLCVYGLETSSEEPVCGKNVDIQSFDHVPLQILNSNNSNHVRKIVNITTNEKCIAMCCDWDDCHFSVQNKFTCYNVHCEDTESCHIIDSSNNSSSPLTTFQLSRVRNSTKLSCSAFSKSCEVGVDNCFESEECVSLGARRRGGCCQCLDGFARNSQGQCINLPMTVVTTQATTTTTQYIRHLAISISPTTIQLPESKSNITVIVVPEPMEGEEYIYKWVVLNYPQNQQPGNIEGNNEKTLQLSQLSPGNYTFQISVNSSKSFGEIMTNVTVLAPKRLNKPPVAVIRPSTQTVHLPNNVSILDGSSSTDDDKISGYKWELERGPISYQFEPSSQETLQLKDLVEGNYTFKLTVTDSDGESNSTFATLEVVKEIDYPPVANAGVAIVIYLPQKELTLNGNQSTDDHGIVGWEWTSENQNSQGKAVDMQNTRTPYLHLSNLEEGMYSFKLKVTDVVGQSTTSSVDVLVRPPLISEINVDAGPNQTISLPLNWVVLNGSRSSDDSRIKSWLWKQLSGPNEAVLTGNEKPVVNASVLTKGIYVFQLTAWDGTGAHSNDTVTVTVTQRENLKPHANAGGDQSVSLPLKWVLLNGSASTDDLGIQSWLWTREHDSLAAGTIVANSDRTSSLMLTNLVPGKYSFRLTVTDAQGLSDHDVCILIVHSNPRESDVVTMTLKSDPRSFTESELTTIRDQIALLLHQQGIVDININMDDVMIEPKSGYVFLQFFTTVKSESGWHTLPGREVASLLKRKLRNDINLMAYPVLEVDTSICQNNCSGHGTCDQVTRHCICQTFWMENPFSVANGEEHNCDWSLLYVILIIGLLFVMVIGIILSLVQMCRKGRVPCKGTWSKKRRRPHRYTPITDPEVIRMTTKNTHTLLPSDIESDSDSDVVFESNHANGRVQNSKSEHIIT